MKFTMHQLLAILVISSSILFCSCSSPLSCRMNEYISDVEAKCPDWTEEDWELSQEEYTKLLEEYELNYNSYTQEEKDAINKAIGRYNGLRIKQGIKEVGSVLKELEEYLKNKNENYIKDFEKSDVLFFQSK